MMMAACLMTGCSKDDRTEGKAVDASAEILVTLDELKVDPPPPVGRDDWEYLDREIGAWLERYEGVELDAAGEELRSEMRDFRAWVSMKMDGTVNDGEEVFNERLKRLKVAVRKLRG